MSNSLIRVLREEFFGATKELGRLGSSLLSDSDISSLEEVGMIERKRLAAHRKLRIRSAFRYISPHRERMGY